MVIWVYCIVDKDDYIRLYSDNANLQRISESAHTKIQAIITQIPDSLSRSVGGAIYSILKLYSKRYDIFLSCVIKNTQIWISITKQLHFCLIKLLTLFNFKFGDWLELWLATWNLLARNLQVICSKMLQNELKCATQLLFFESRNTCIC